MSITILLDMRTAQRARLCSVFILSEFRLVPQMALHLRLVRDGPDGRAAVYWTAEGLDEVVGLPALRPASHVVLHFSRVQTPEALEGTVATERWPRARAAGGLGAARMHGALRGTRELCPQFSAPYLHLVWLVVFEREPSRSGIDQWSILRWRSPSGAEIRLLGKF